MRSDLERWAEALAIEKLHGDDATTFLDARIDELARCGDMAGVARLREIADKLASLAPPGSACN